ncbi:MAG: ABC-type multidrug transport system fused ATPase/permease subunit [Polaribacter sp.]|jgi:ABC-type multidrug transport system fused ATPase/permease subunit
MASFLEKIKSTTVLQLASRVRQDAIRPYRGQIRWIVVFQILSVLANFGAFAVLYYYVDLVENNRAFSISEYTFEPRQSQSLLIIIAITVGFLFLGSGSLEYLFQKRLIAINRLFEVSCVKRLYESVVSKSALLNYQDSPILSAYNIKKSLIKDTKFYGRALYSIVRSIIPIAKLAISMIFMFYLAFSFTLLVVLLMLIGFFFIWKVSKSVVKETNRKEKYIKPYVRELASALAKPIPSDTLVSNDSASNYFSAFYTWLLNNAQNQFIIKILIAVITTFLLLIIGHLTLFGNASWALLIGYLLALRYFLNSLQGINGILKQLSTFYDYIRNYYAILDGLLDLENLDLSQHSIKQENLDTDFFQFQPEDDTGDDLVDEF